MFICRIIALYSYRLHPQNLDLIFADYNTKRNSRNQYEQHTLPIYHFLPELAFWPLFTAFAISGII